MEVTVPDISDLTPLPAEKDDRKNLTMVTGKKKGARTMRFKFGRLISGLAFILDLIQGQTKLYKPRAE